MKRLWNLWNSMSLVLRILFGIIIGLVLALTIPEQASFVSIFGSLFVSALKAVAPVLVFFLVLHAVGGQKKETKTNMKTVIVLYAIGTFLAGFVAVVVSYIFPTKLTLQSSAENVTPLHRLVGY